MKKIVLLAFAVLLFNQVNGQNKGDFEFGFHAGLNISNVAASNAENANSTIGFNVGGLAEYYFSEAWGLKMKAIYDQKGWGDGFFSDDNGTITTDFNVNYLTVPVTANWHFGRTNNWYLSFGAYAGFLLSAEAQATGLDVKDGFESTDFGIALGLGVKIPVSDFSKFIIEYDGQAGLSEVFIDNPGPTVRNGRSSINVGMVFIVN